MTDHDNDLRGIDRAPIQQQPFPHPSRPEVDARPTTDPVVDGERVPAVCGRVGTWDEAGSIREGLLRDGFGADDVEVFYTGPAGRHAVTPIGGDASADAGSKHVGTGAAVGGATGAAVGLAVGAAVAAAPVVVPVLLTAAAVGAFGGALAGGVAATEDGADERHTPEHPVAQPGGVVVAIRTDRGIDGQSRALAHLTRGGAVALERATARWLDGHWIDWDPVGQREQLAPEHGMPQADTPRS